MKATECLIDVAAAVSDGAVVDWGRTESEAPLAARHLVGHLRVLERVASVHAALPPITAFERSLHDSLWHPAAAAEAPRVDTPATWGPLTIVERIGSGTYADVYRARDPRLDRPVALKLLRHRDDGGTASESEAIEEARLLARIRHPNVVTVYGAERIDGRAGIWMELVDGQTLERELHDRGPFSAKELGDVGTVLCRALDAVHSAGLLHRDVKAQNVMRDGDGRVLLTDFGTGRDLADQGGTPELAGTPLYLAPEVLNGTPASTTSDVYSLGVLLYHLATGSFPVSGRSLSDLSDAHARGIHVPLQEARRDLPKRLAIVIDRAATADVGRRYESARAFETALVSSTVSRKAWLRRAAVIIGTGLVALSGAYVATHWTGRATVPFRAHDWVLVTAFDNRTGEKQFDRVLEHVLTYELSDSSYVNVVPPERVDDALRLMARAPTTVVDSATGPAVALRDGGIRLVLDGEIDRLGMGYSMTVRVVDPHSASTLARDREEAPTTKDVLSAMRRLSTSIRLRLGEAPATVALDNEQAEKAKTPSLRALGDYAEALQAFNLARLTEAEALLKSAVSEDPSFASAHIWLAWAQQNLNQPRDVYLRSARRAVELMGTATERERYWILGSYYLMTNQDQLAIAQYEPLARRYPDDRWVLADLVRLYGRNGRMQDAVNMLVRIANSRPGDFAAQVLAAQGLLSANGRDAARPFIARAQMLVSTASDTVNGATPLRSWVLIFPAFDLWVQGRGTEAAAALDAASKRPEVDAEGPAALNLLGKSHLALGQVHLAEAAFARLTGPARDLAMSEVALARNDLPAIVRLLSSYRGLDPLAVSLLVRAGDVRGADRLFQTNSFNLGNQTRAGWAADEIAEARGDDPRIRAALKGDFPWIQGFYGGARAFLYSETLSRAAVAAGDITDAIRVLEETEAVGETVYPPSTHSGYYWMRTETLLADLYRQTGHIDKARSIERHLLATLSAADDDYPLLLELKARSDH